MQENSNLIQEENNVAREENNVAREENNIVQEENQDASLIIINSLFTHLNKVYEYSDAINLHNFKVLRKSLSQHLGCYNKNIVFINDNEAVKTRFILYLNEFMRGQRQLNGIIKNVRLVGKDVNDQESKNLCKAFENILIASRTHLKKYIIKNTRQIKLCNDQILEKLTDNYNKYLRNLDIDTSIEEVMTAVNLTFGDFDKYHLDYIFSDYIVLNCKRFKICADMMDDIEFRLIAQYFDYAYTDIWCGYRPDLELYINMLEAINNSNLQKQEWNNIILINYNKTLEEFIQEALPQAKAQKEIYMEYMQFEKNEKNEDTKYELNKKIEKSLLSNQEKEYSADNFFNI